MEIKILWQTLENWQKQNGFIRKHITQGIIPDAEAREILLSQNIHPLLRECLDMDTSWQTTAIRGLDGEVMIVVGLPQS